MDQESEPSNSCLASAGFDPCFVYSQSRLITERQYPTQESWRITERQFSEWSVWMLNYIQCHSSLCYNSASRRYCLRFWCLLWPPVLWSLRRKMWRKKKKKFKFMFHSFLFYVPVRWIMRSSNKMIGSLQYTPSLWCKPLSWYLSGSLKALSASFSLC